MPLHVQRPVFAALPGIVLAVALAACATSSPQSSYSPDAPSGTGGAGMRELTPDEKRIIMDSLVSSLRDPAAAKYRWAKFGGSGNYCAMVNAKSPYPAYNGWQSYIVEVSMSGGTITSAVVGLIAGGADTALVKKMCARYGLDPANAI